ncbi:hypothetical protein [Lacticaseibacillus hegangensis]|uniref:WxL domain-containing protein n=1 Tax=Lacticaseibacillus hegangensis TaxID=2486010 RepID=A0ABW4CZD4_9LACO|nr:hypothetical protein [Lacticaseibacillus hegangensis]
MRQKKILSLVTLACALAMPLSSISPVLAIDDLTPATTSPVDTALAETDTTETASAADASAEQPSVAVPAPEAAAPEPAAPAETPDQPATPAPETAVPEATAPEAETPAEAVEPVRENWQGKATSDARLGTSWNASQPIGTTVNVGDRVVMRYSFDRGSSQNIDWGKLQAEFAIPADYQLAAENGRVTIQVNGANRQIQTSNLNEFKLGQIQIPTRGQATVDVPLIAKNDQGRQNLATGNFFVGSHHATTSKHLTKPRHQVSLTVPGFNFGQTSVRDIALGQVTLSTANSTMAVKNTHEAGRVTASMTSFKLGQGYQAGNVALQFGIGNKAITLRDDATPLTIADGKSNTYQLTNSKLIINQFRGITAGEKAAEITWTLTNAH